MQKYLEPILTAAVFFPLLAALFTLPYMIYCYRRYGAVLVMRVALMYAFLYYLICVYFLAILPFPREGTVVTQRTTVNLIPFNYVPEVLDSGVTFSWGDPKSWLVAIYSSGLYEPLCNVLMFFPLGIFLRYYFGCGRLKTVVIAFLGSLFLELTQLTGTYGLAPFVYRCCDVNDLIGNTLGGWLGYVCTPLFTCFLPSRERLNQVSYQRGSPGELCAAWLCFPGGRRGGGGGCCAPVADPAPGAALRHCGSGPGRGHPLPGHSPRPVARSNPGQGPGEDPPDGCAHWRHGEPGTLPAAGVLLWGVLLQPLAQPLPCRCCCCVPAYNGIRNRPQMFYEKWLGLTQASTVTSTQKKAEKPQDAH